MKIRAALSFAAFGAIIFFAFSYFAAMGLKVAPPPQRTNISMEVADINGLVVGSSVQLRGVPIGQVQSITAALAGATVNFYVDGRFKIPQDSDVRLENLSALGESYIELQPGNAEGPAWRDGERLATTAVTQPPSISELATSVVRVLGEMDPGALKRILAEADAALPSPTTTLPNLSRASTLLRDTAANMNGKGRDLLDNFQTLLRNADFVGPVLAFNAPYIAKIGTTLDSEFNCIVEGYNRGGPQTIKNFAHFVARIEHLLDNTHGDIKVLMQSLLPYLNDISGALMNLDTSQVFARMLADVPEDGALTLHVTVPDAGVPEESVGAPPATAAPGTAAPEEPPLTGAPAAPPHPGSAGVFFPKDAAIDPNAPPESVLPDAACHAVYPTATAPAPHPDATPRAPGQPFPPFDASGH